jgi:membrane protease subunit (stomatin/prohibitin family)
MTENLENVSKFKVTDRKSFIEFIRLLRRDFEVNNWENNNLADFLEAMERYAEEVQGYYNNTQQNINANEPSWQVFADILMGSTMYE